MEWFNETRKNNQQRVFRIGCHWCDYPDYSLFTAPLPDSFGVVAIFLLILSFVMSLLLPKRDLRLWILIGWTLLLLYVVVMTVFYGVLFLNAMFEWEIASSLSFQTPTIRRTPCIFRSTLHIKSVSTIERRFSIISNRSIGLRAGDWTKKTWKIFVEKCKATYLKVTKSFGS